MAKDKDHNAHHIGQAIQDLLKTYHIKNKFDEANLTTSWERLVGKPVAKRTRKIFLKNRVLFVEMDSPSMKHDLNLHKNHLLETFQKEFGREIIGEIVIM